MSSYPGAYDEFRTVQNIPGILYDAEDTKTVFAEDANAHSDAISAIETTLGVNPQGDYSTVADRLDASGGGGGAWEFVTELVASGSETELNVTDLDLVSDSSYLVFFSVYSSSAEVYLDWYGTFIITQAWNGQYSASGSVTGIFNKTYLSHRSLGPGVGSMILQTTPNGTASANINYTIGNGRAIQAGIIDSAWYSGGVNLTRLRLSTNPTEPLQSNSKITVYKRKM